MVGWLVGWVGYHQRGIHSFLVRYYYWLFGLYYRQTHWEGVQKNKQASALGNLWMEKFGLAGWAFSVIFFEHDIGATCPLIICVVRYLPIYLCYSLRAVECCKMLPCGGYYISSIFAFVFLDLPRSTPLYF